MLIQGVAKAMVPDGFGPGAQAQVHVNGEGEKHYEARKRR